MEPQLIQVRNGWAAAANHWAVFGKTKEEAEAKFREAERRHQEMAARPEPQAIA